AAPAKTQGDPRASQDGRPRRGHQGQPSTQVPETQGSGAGLCHLPGPGDAAHGRRASGAGRGAGEAQRRGKGGAVTADGRQAHGGDGGPEVGGGSDTTGPRPGELRPFFFAAQNAPSPFYLAVCSGYLTTMQARVEAGADSSRRETVWHGLLG